MSADARLCGFAAPWLRDDEAWAAERLPVDDVLAAAAAAAAVGEMPPVLDADGEEVFGGLAAAEREGRELQWADTGADLFDAEETGDPFALLGPAEQLAARAAVQAAAATAAAAAAARAAEETAVAEATAAAAAAASSYASRKSFSQADEEAMLDCLREGERGSEDGCTVEYAALLLRRRPSTRHISREAIAAIVAALAFDGFIYATVDESTFKTTT